MNGPTVRLTSMAGKQIAKADLYEIGHRALALGCHVGVQWSSRHGWLASASSDAFRTERVARATVYDALEAALDEFEAHLFTADELLTIQRQSVA